MVVPPVVAKWFVADGLFSVVVVVLAAVALPAASLPCFAVAAAGEIDAAQLVAEEVEYKLAVDVVALLDRLARQPFVAAPFVA